MHVQSLKQEDDLEQTCSSILAWKIPEEPGGLQSMRSQRVRHDRATTHLLQLLTLASKPSDIGQIGENQDSDF